MFIVVWFIRSPGSAIVAEANLRCGDFSSEKIVVTVLAVFSFLSWLPDVPWVFINLNNSAAFFGVENALLTCYWYLWVLSSWFQFFSVESCHFMFLSVMRFFLLQVFPFLIRVSGWYYLFDVLIFIHLFNSTGVVVAALANLRWSVYVSIKFSQIGSFH